MVGGFNDKVGDTQNLSPKLFEIKVAHLSECKEGIHILASKKLLSYKACNCLGNVKTVPVGVVVGIWA